MGVELKGSSSPEEIASDIGECEDYCYFRSLKMDLRLYIIALQCGMKKLGLSLSDFRVDIWRVKKSNESIVHVVIADAMQFEIGDSYYGHYYPAPDHLSFQVSSSNAWNTSPTPNSLLKTSPTLLPPKA